MGSVFFWRIEKVHFPWEKLEDGMDFKDKWIFGHASQAIRRGTLKIGMKRALTYGKGAWIPPQLSHGSIVVFRTDSQINAPYCFG